MQSNVSAICGIVLRFKSLYGAGYCDTHFKIAMSLFPTDLHASTALSISANVAMPVESIIGFQRLAQRLIRGISKISYDAIL